MIGVPTLRAPTEGIPTRGRAKLMMAAAETADVEVT
jgi:hypothetical protein